MVIKALSCLITVLCCRVVTGAWVGGPCVGIFSSLQGWLCVGVLCALQCAKNCVGSCRQSLGSLNVCRVSFRVTYNVPRLCVRAGFLALTLIRSRKLKFSTNVHTKHVRPPDAKPLLAAYSFLSGYNFLFFSSRLNP